MSSKLKGTWTKGGVGTLGQANGSGHSESEAGTDVLRTGVCFIICSIENGGRLATGLS
jgi:hypothetical protein